MLRCVQDEAQCAMTANAKAMSEMAAAFAEKAAEMAAKSDAEEEMLIREEVLTILQAPPRCAPRHIISHA